MPTQTITTDVVSVLDIRRAESCFDFVDCGYLLSLQARLNGINEIQVISLASAYAKRRKDFPIWIARRGQDEFPTGYALGDNGERDIGRFMIGYVFVAPGERGKGIGRTLEKAQIDFARERGFREVYTAIARTNLPSLAVSRSLGFSFSPLDADYVQAILKLDKNL